jgi:hypothetical protein
MSGTIKTATVLGAIFLLIAGIAVLSSCSEDCPTGPVQPKPYNGWLYATGPGNNYIYRIDTETDSLVDSVKSEISDDFSPGRPVISEDGRYLAIAFLDNLNEQYFMRIYNAQTMSIITDINHSVYPHNYLLKDDLLVTVGNKRLIYYSIPDFAIAGEDSLLNNSDSISSSILNIDEENGLYYLWVTLSFPDGRDSTWLASYDYDKREIVDEWEIDIEIGGSNTFTFSTVKLHSNPLRMYFLGYSELENGILGCYDFKSKRLLFVQRLESHWGSFDISPDEKELYATDPGWFNDRTNAGTVYVFDAMTGVYLHGISLYGYNTIPDRPLYANNVVFTPTGEKAYVASGRLEKGSGTICVINTSTRDITRLIWPDLGHYIFRLVIGPKI